MRRRGFGQTFFFLLIMRQLFRMGERLCKTQKPKD